VTYAVLPVVTAPLPRLQLCLVHQRQMCPALVGRVDGLPVRTGRAGDGLMNRGPGGIQCEFTDADCDRRGPGRRACEDCPNRPQRCLVCGAETWSWPFDLCPACQRRCDTETIYRYYVRSRHTSGWLQEVFKHKPITHTLMARGFRLAADLDGWVEATFKRMTGWQALPSPRKPSRIYRLQRDGLLPRVSYGNRLPAKDRREAWLWLYAHSPPSVRRLLSDYQMSHLWSTFRWRSRGP